MKHDLLYVFCSPTKAFDPPQVYYNLAKSLALKNEVIFCSLPIEINPTNKFGIVTYATLLSQALCTKHAHLVLWDYPATIPILNRTTRRLNIRISLILLRIYILIRKYIHKKVVIFYSLTPEQNRLYNYIPFSYTVYDCLDVFNPNQIHNNKIYISKFDLVFAHNQLLQSRLMNINKNTKLVAHGATDLIEIRNNKHRVSNSVVFVGGISKRIDYDILEKVVTKLSTVHFYFLGEEYLLRHYVSKKDYVAMRQWKHICKNSNVHFLSIDTHPNIYILMELFQVAILPYKSQNNPNEYANREVTPMKILGYMANNLPIVSTALPIMQSYESKFPIFCTDNPDVFASQIIQIIQNPHLFTYAQSRLKRFIKNSILNTKIRQIAKHVNKLYKTGQPI